MQQHDRHRFTNAERPTGSYGAVRPTYQSKALRRPRRTVSSMLLSGLDSFLPPFYHTSPNPSLQRRGSLFLDGTHLVTPELEQEIDRISKHFDGFYFGRYDIKVPSVEALQQGEGLRILELNGITSEATSIYDPKNGLFTAYKVLFNQWAIASKIVTQNNTLKIKPARHREVIKQLLAYRNHEKVEI